MEEIKILIKNILTNELHATANIYFNNNQAVDALNIYLEIIELLINNKITDNIFFSLIYSNISACHLKNKNYIKSLETGLISTQYNLHNAKAWGRIGWSYKGLKINNNAYKSFTLASKINPSNIYYKKEIELYESKILNKNNLFKLFLNDVTLLNKLKDKNNIANILKGNLNDDILLLIDDVINKLN